jgi:hypothetical protein
VRQVSGGFGGDRLGAEERIADQPVDALLAPRDENDVLYQNRYWSSPCVIRVTIRMRA